jgi:Raf kinase inhibitor-like YbhB/YbcL family protein
MKIYRTSLMAFVLALVLSGCGKNFELQSKAFYNNEPIPEKYWYNLNEQDISLPFNWLNPPAGTRSFALIMHHQAKTLNWVVFNIPANCKEFPEGASGGNMPAGSVELYNHSRQLGYYGPSPLRNGGTYEWTIELYALNTASLNVPDGFKPYEDLYALLEDKIIGSAVLIGTASRR